MGRLVAMVLGSSADWLEDAVVVRTLVEPDIVVAVNQAAVHWRGSVDHMATMHPELVPKWLTERAKLGLPRPRSLWCPAGRPRPRLDGYEFSEAPAWGGSSGLLAVAVALQLGASHVICAGVPLMPNAAHFHDKRKWPDARRYHSAWERKLPVLKDRVRSCSGWTRELLGAPTAEWLEASDKNQ
jgi:hypothetical protein